MGRGCTGTMAPVYGPGVRGAWPWYPPLASISCWDGALLGLRPIISPILGEMVCIPPGVCGGIRCGSIAKAWERCG